MAIDPSRHDGNTIDLRAGPVQATFADGELRRLRVGSVEIIRRIFVGVRDPSWGSVPAVVSDVCVESDRQRQSIRFLVDHSADEIAFRWAGQIQLTCDNNGGELKATVSFEMDGRALKGFQTNRTGLCVLHPLASCQGKQVRIVERDGSVRMATFPELVSPDTIASEISRLRYEPFPGLHLDIEFDGELFETEDQRNWADGSYKTYCRPLSRPFPYELSAGERVWQKVRVHVNGRVPIGQSAVPTLTVGRVIGAMPAIGLCYGPLLNSSQVEGLKGLSLAYLRVDVRLASDAWRTEMHRAAENARCLEIPIEMGVHLAASGYLDLEQFCADAARIGVPIARWLVYRDRQPVPYPVDLEMFAQAIRAVVPGAIVGCGTIGSFAELNRNRPQGSPDALAWSVCPQIHASDNDTLIEGLESLPAAVATARSFAGGAHLAVGPIRFWKTPDPFAAGNDGKPKPVAPDARLPTRFGAAWTLGCISALAQAQAGSITLYQTVGPLGVVDENGESPLYRLLREIGEFAGGSVKECKSSDPCRAACLAIELRGRVRIWIASLDARGGEICLINDRSRRSFHFDGINVQRLDLEDAQ